MSANIELESIFRFPHRLYIEGFKTSLPVILPGWGNLCSLKWAFWKEIYQVFFIGLQKLKISFSTIWCMQTQKHWGRWKQRARNTWKVGRGILLKLNLILYGNEKTCRGGLHFLWVAFLLPCMLNVQCILLMRPTIIDISW